MINVFLFGTPRLERDGAHVHVARRKGLALVAYLALEPHRVNRDMLATLLWPDDDQSTARAHVRRVLSALTTAFKEPLFEAERESIGLLQADHLWIDAVAFREHWAAVNAHDHQDVIRCEACLTRLKQAVECYQADFLAGFTLRDSPSFDDWQTLHAEEFRQIYARMLGHLIAAAEAHDVYHQAIHYARRLVTLNPFDESSQRWLMKLLALTGDLVGALRQYEDCARILRDELALEPQAETTLLYEQIRSGALRPPVAAPVAVRHRSPIPGARLPAQSTPLIGRDDEIAAIIAVIQSTEARLFTLLGPPGVGKTRLGIQVAANLAPEFADGLCFVDLAPLEQPQLVLPSIARQLGVMDRGDQTLSITLYHYLHDRQILLVLDNFEQVMAATGDLLELLASAPQIRIVVTSRRALGLSSEHRFFVNPLTLPDATEPLEALLAYPSIRLFVSRAQAVCPGWELTEHNAQAVQAICHQLDGLPLALELAAAWSHLLDPHTILERLRAQIGWLRERSDYGVERQQSLVVTLEWSLLLLSVPERLLFRRLAIFASGWTLEAAEAVCSDADLPAPAVLELLGQLVDQSLVVVEIRAEGRRYRFLETVRRFAWEQLEEAGEIPHLYQRMAAFYCAFVEQRVPHLHSCQQSRIFSQLAEEADNVRVALESCLVSSASPEMRSLGARLAGLLGHFWYLRSSWRKGRQWLERALASMPDDCPDRALVLMQLGSLAKRQSQFGLAREFLDEALVLWQQHGDQAGIALTLTYRGQVCRLLDEHDVAESLLEKAIMVATPLEEEWVLAFACSSLGALWVKQRNIEPAKAVLTKSLAIWRSLDASWGIAETVRYLAWIEMEEGNLDTVRTLIEECMSVWQLLGDHHGLGQGLNTLGEVFRLQGRMDDAERCYTEALAIWRMLGRPVGIANELHNLAQIALDQGNLDSAHELFCDSLRMYRHVGSTAVGVASSLSGMARLAVFNGELERAVYLLSAVASIYHVTLSAPDQRLYEQTLHDVRQRVHEPRFQTVWEEGQLGDVEQMVDYALDERPTLSVAR